MYVLLAGDASGNVYVGKATALRKRLQNHNSRPPLPWARALIVRRDTTHGFNSAEIGYLEGRLSAELGEVTSLSVVKGKSDEDTTLPPQMTLLLDSLLGSILAAVRLAGVNLAKEVGEYVPSGKRKKHTSVPGTVADLVAAGLIRAGEVLYLTQAQVRATGTIAANGDIVVHGVAYSSPSAAAAKALGLQSSNGWAAWHVGTAEGHWLDHYRRLWLSDREGRR